MRSKENGESYETCKASIKQRRKWCTVDRPNYLQCVQEQHCEYANFQVNLGQPNLRGGVETAEDSAKIRKEILKRGIPTWDS
jgi:hypothetical protein